MNKYAAEITVKCSDGDVAAKFWDWWVGAGEASFLKTMVREGTPVLTDGIQGIVPAGFTITVEPAHLP